jgi:tetratricopeptide (TPR) repeat protein
MKFRRATVLLLASVLWADIVIGAPKISPKVRASAQKVYIEGARHYRAGRYPEALQSFKRSYEIFPSPNSHLMMARAMRESGDFVAAFAEYQRILPEAQAAAHDDARYGQAAEAAQRELTEVRAKITMLVVRVVEPPGGLKVVLGDRELAPETWDKPIPMPPGRMRIMAIAPDRADDKREPIGQPGDEVVVEFSFKKTTEPMNRRMPSLVTATDPQPAEPAPLAAAPAAAPAASSSQKTWAYAAGAAGLAGLTTFVIFGSLTRSHYNDLDASCPLGHCPPGRVDDIEAGRREQVIANVGLTVGLIGLGAGAALWLTRDGQQSSGEENARRKSDVFVSSRGVTFAGTF